MIHTISPVTPSPTSAQRNSCHPVTDPPPAIGIAVPNPVSSAMTIAISTTEIAPVTTRPL